MCRFDVHAWVQANTTEADKQAMENGDGLRIAGGGVVNEDRIGIVLSEDKDEATRKLEREKEAAAKRFVGELLCGRCSDGVYRQQNQMPSWHTKSTITGDLTALGMQQAAHLEGDGESGNAHILDSLIAVPVEKKPDVGKVTEMGGEMVCLLVLACRPLSSSGFPGGDPAVAAASHCLFTAGP